MRRPAPRRAGRPMTARKSPAGRSAPSFAAAALCGKAKSSHRARAGRWRFPRPLSSELPYPLQAGASRSVPGDEKCPLPGRRDADAIEDISAELLHVVEIAGGDDLEQLDPLL